MERKWEAGDMEGGGLGYRISTLKAARTAGEAAVISIRPRRRVMVSGNLLAELTSVYTYGYT